MSYTCKDKVAEDEFQVGCLVGPLIGMRLRVEEIYVCVYKYVYDTVYGVVLFESRDAC